MCMYQQAEFRQIFAPIRCKSLKKLPLSRRRRIFSGFCQTANGPKGDTRMDADKIRYMRIQSENDSESVKAVKWSFCSLVTLSLNHPAITEGIQGTLETLFDYCQYLIEAGQ